MPGFIIGAQVDAFANGTKIIAGKVSIKVSDKAEAYPTFDGILLASKTGKCTLSFDVPIEAADALDVADATAVLSKTPITFTIVVRENGRSYTLQGMPDSNDAEFGAEQAGKGTRNYICTIPLVA